MPRMFDILRNKVPQDEAGQPKDDEGKKEAVPENTAPTDNAQQAPAEQPLSFPKNIIAIDKKQTAKKEDCALLSKKLISAVRKYGVDNKDRTQEIYEDAVGIVNILLEKVRLKGDLLPYIDKIEVLLDDIFNQLVLGDSILDNIYVRERGEYYLPYHITNVMVLSSVIGLNMGFNKSRLNHLGLAAIFYDIGMDPLREIAGQPRQLTEEELVLIKTHISKSLKVVDRIPAINDLVKETIRMHHERFSGKGYPRGIKSENINPYAKIIGLADTYEALTNSRPYRQGMSAHKAIRFLLAGAKDYFDPDVLKVFINKMSVYPIGSIVRLDTQELAKVISVEPGSPLRPVVMIIRDASNEPPKENIIIDLSNQDFPSIQDSV